MWIRRLSEAALAATLVLASAPSAAAPPDDPFADYRERFKLGMDRYKSGAYAEAIGYWEPIYGELGAHKGYRLAYDLGIAYQEIGDATRGAERLQSFVAEVEAVRGRGETVPAIVLTEEAEARARVESLAAARGRIHVDPGTPPRSVQVDAMEPRLAAFVAWVSPGQHTVTFGPGSAAPEQKSVEVRAGEIVEVSPTPAPAPAPAPPSAPAPAPSAGPVDVRAATPPPVTHRETAHPFSPVVLFVGGGFTVAAGVASIALEANAWSLHDRFAGERPVPAADQSSFDAARTWAYGMVGTAVGLGVVTAALSTWYLLGASERDVVVTPGGVAGRF